MAALLTLSVVLALHVRRPTAWPRARIRAAAAADALPELAFLPDRKGELRHQKASAEAYDFHATCAARHSPLVSLARDAANKWRSQPSAISDARWQQALDAIPDADTLAAVAIVGNEVYLTRPIADMPLLRRHIWLRGMLAQLVAAARIAPLPNVQFILSTRDLIVAPRHTFREYVPVLGVVQEARAKDASPSSPQPSHAVATSWDIAVPGGTFAIEDNREPPFSAFATEAAVAAAAHPWPSRRSAAIFRGSLRCHNMVNCSTCSRAVAACIGQDSRAMLDVALPAAADDSPRCEATAPCKLERRSPADGLPMLDHVKYKYSLQLDGHSYSYRLQKLLALGTTVLRQASPFQEFYEPLLQSGVHVWPMSACSSLAACDVLSQLRTAQADEHSAESVASAGYAFAHTHLAPVSGRLCYWVALVTTLAPRLPTVHSVGAGWQVVTDDDIPSPTAQDLEALRDFMDARV